jgi:hypothetical protein
MDIPGRGAEGLSRQSWDNRGPGSVSNSGVNSASKVESERHWPMRDSGSRASWDDADSDQQKEKPPTMKRRLNMVDPTDPKKYKSQPLP